MAPRPAGEHSIRPAVQTPVWVLQVPPPGQPFPCWQPLPGVQVSVGPAIPSSRLGGAPPLQTPPEQTSPVVQTLPSSQELLLGTFWQPPAGLQLSAVQALPSLKLTAAPPCN